MAKTKKVDSKPVQMDRTVRLVRGSKTVGYAYCPQDIEIVVVNDTRGYASDVYVYNEAFDSYVYQASRWIGLHEMTRGRDWYLKLCEAASGHALVGKLAASRYAIEQAEHVLNNNDDLDPELDRHYLTIAIRTFKKCGG